MNTATLIRMANQIAHNYAAYPTEVATQKLVTFLEDTWEERMLRDLFAYVESDGAGIEPVVRNAAMTIRSHH